MLEALEDALGDGEEGFGFGRSFGAEACNANDIVAVTEFEEDVDIGLAGVVNAGMTHEEGFIADIGRVGDFGVAGSVFGDLVIAGKGDVGALDGSVLDGVAEDLVGEDGVVGGADIGGPPSIDAACFVEVALAFFFAPGLDDFVIVVGTNPARIGEDVGSFGGEVGFAAKEFFGVGEDDTGIRGRGGRRGKGWCEGRSHSRGRRRGDGGAGGKGCGGRWGSSGWRGRRRGGIAGGGEEKNSDGQKANEGTHGVLPGVVDGEPENGA